MTYRSEINKMRKIYWSAFFLPPCKLSFIPTFNQIWGNTHEYWSHCSWVGRLQCYLWRVSSPTLTNLFLPDLSLFRRLPSTKRAPSSWAGKVAGTEIWWNLMFFSAAQSTTRWQVLEERSEEERRWKIFACIAYGLVHAGYSCSCISTKCNLEFTYIFIYNTLHKKVTLYFHPS